MSLLRAALPKGRTHWLLSVGTLIDSAGFGLFVTAGLVYFTRSAGFTVGQVGVGMSLAGFVGFAAAIPAGHLADRFGARQISVWMSLAQAVTMACFVLVRSFSGFLVVICLFACAERGGATVRQALVGRLYTDGSKVAVQAYLRSVFNVGVSVGTLAAGVVLQADRPSLYMVLIMANALSFVALAGLNASLPATPPTLVPVYDGPRRAVLRDLPYVSVGLLNGLLGLHTSVLMIGLPLWVTLHTNAPRSTVAGLFFANTVLAVALQVRASRGSDSVPGAGRAVVQSSVASAAACLLFAPTAGLPVFWTVAALLVATVALTVGELLQSAGGWGLSFGLARDQQQGAYLGAFSLGGALRDGVGPIIVTSLAVSYGPAGWLGLALVFLMLGAAGAPLIRWAVRSRKPPAVTQGERDSVHAS